MSKDLLLVGQSEFQDFRDNIVLHYKAKGCTPIFSKDFYVSDYTLIFNGKSFPPQNTLIFNQPGTLGFLGKDTLFPDFGFTVDIATSIRALTEKKEILFSLLRRRYKGLLPSMYVDSFPPSKYYLKYPFAGRSFELIKKTDTGMSAYGTYASWHEDKIRGTLVLFYLYEPVCITNIIIEYHDDISVELIHPFKKFLKFINKHSSSIYAADMYEVGGMKNDDVISLRDIDHPSKDFIDSAKIIPEILRSPICECIFAKDENNNMVLINVNSGHTNLSKSLFHSMKNDLLDKEIFARFDKFMEI